MTLSIDDYAVSRAQNPANVETFEGDISAFASSGGKVITATCTPNTLKVEPFNNPGGVGSIDQPEGLPDGFDVAVQIPGKGTLSMKVSNKAITQWLPGIAGRWMGEVKAGFKGKTQWTGSAFYEAFTFN